MRERNWDELGKFQGWDRNWDELDKLAWEKETGMSLVNWDELDKLGREKVTG